jgi:hypothetical protein
MFKLTFHRGSLSGETLNISAPKIMLGRSCEFCDVWLDDDGVSRRHCYIEKRMDGIYVCDLGSTNGVRINGARMRGMECRLEDGDEVQLGTARFSFAAPEAEPLLSEVAQPEPKSARREKFSLASLPAFWRTSYGGVVVGVCARVSLALLLRSCCLSRASKLRTLVAERYEHNATLLQTTPICFHCLIERTRFDNCQSQPRNHRRNKSGRTTPTRQKRKMCLQLSAKSRRRR